MMPLTTQRWAMRKATRVGSKAMRYDAKATLKLVVNWFWNRYWTHREGLPASGSP